MTVKEFISRPHFCTDSGTVFSPREDYCTDGAVVVPAGGSRQRGKSAAAQLRKLSEAAELSAKLDRAIELLTGDTALREQQKARRNMPVGSLPGVLSERELADQWRKAYEAREAQLCAEAKAAYDARNPHKKDCGR